TTRLSRVTITRASDVTTNVQSIRLFAVPPFIWIPPWLVSGYSFRWQKKRRLVLHAEGEHLLGPRVLRVEQVHRDDDVDQHPLREERRERVGVDARGALDGVDQLAEALPGDGADVGIATCGVRLHLRTQAIRV